MQPCTLMPPNLGMQQTTCQDVHWTNARPHKHEQVRKLDTVLCIQCHTYSGRELHQQQGSHESPANYFRAQEPSKYKSVWAR